ncbi:four-carbon acid sugar kinase family protein [Tianweitania sediminis]|uniref:Four-carbon acid sugar kinase family protein n=1 Tax=Tianweitania sediminis TaxID=1502156 RepID=A0A8J7R1B4_9HYPH|nr:four-carbon acid sugar kinase family protein [Tianweitania sediminis]MBP0439487.1 four-carbon acid sugar kinase family protein [Tianweitania sediminis]
MSRIVFIGDDFTGASDTLAAFSERGAKARLFLDVPTKEETGGLHAVGIATDLRSRSAEEITEKLEEMGPALIALKPSFIHYKICSTFDSAPHVGSIGAAVRALEAQLAPSQTIVLGGQPSLGRFCIFGTLFARAPDGVTYRIDRHPIMSRHPVTPMAEADLRRHLAEQGLDALHLIDHFQIGGLSGDLGHRRRLLVDALDQADVDALGQALRAREAQPTSTLIVGSSSVAEALWPSEAESRTDPGVTLSAPGPRLAIAGSRSSATAAQVAAAACYKKFALEAGDLANPQAVATQVGAALSAGRNVLVHLQADLDYGQRGAVLSRKLAELTAATLQISPVRALAVAGGDTSSTVVEHLGFRSLSFVSRAGPGVAICRGHAPDAPLDGTLLLLKGGQVGAPDLFDSFAAA